MSYSILRLLVGLHQARPLEYKYTGHAPSNQRAQPHFDNFNIMLIHELDADVLRLVAAYVAQSRKTADILAFAITCRHVYKAARPFIPSRLDMNIPSTTFLLLRRTLIEDESYGLGVHLLRIGPCKTKHEPAQKDMRDFFQLIPNLRTLLAYYSSLSIIPIILSPETLFRRSLRRLFLGCEIKCTASELFEIAHLPNIRQLEVQNFLDFEHEELSSSKAPNFKLKHLKFVRGQISRQTLSSLIVASPLLATLVCRTPLDELSTKGVYPGSALISVPLSPISILPTLAPISQTLVKLDLFTSGQEWSGHDGTRLDLTSFTKMRLLYASAELFVAPHVLGVSRDGLFKLLPPSLRNFRVSARF